MLLIQMTGLPGAGKTTISNAAKKLLKEFGHEAEIIDGDVYRLTLCKDLGYSKKDRCENIRRLGALAHSFVQRNKIAIIAAINPYEEIRRELTAKYGARTVWVHCPFEVLLQRDPKGLYRRAFLPDQHPDKIRNLTGVNDPYEEPTEADLILNTGENAIIISAQMLAGFIIKQLKQ